MYTYPNKPQKKQLVPMIQVGSVSSPLRPSVLAEVRLHGHGSWGQSQGLMPPARWNQQHIAWVGAGSSEVSG